MVYYASILLASILPAVMGIKLNTPVDTAADGTLLITWTPAATDPTMAMVLDGPISVDIATGVASAAGNTSVGLGNIPPGTYKLQAVVGDDLATILDTSGDFKILAAGTAAAAPPAAAPPAAAPPAAASSAAAAPPPAAAAGTNAAGGPPFDPAGVPNVGNGAGKQFIGGQCLNAADCASGCCAGPSGICSGPGAQTQAGKTGCGFVSGSSSLTTAAAAAASPPAAAPTAAAPPAAAAGTNAAGGPPFDPAGVPNVGNGAGKQFIGGQCLNAADCASGCCAGPSGICSGVGAQTQAGKTGCGFVSGSSSLTTGAAAAPAAAAPAASKAGTNAAGGPPFDPAGVPNVGNGAGKQFIGGQCLAAADCASGCCAGPSGICSGVGAQTQAGKTGCGFVSKRFVTRSRAVLADLLQ
ncbi:hypothetical protein B0H14DRAFT_2621275 [Mycena olivaceomarginata]|nr:hypothetical protein B0H14DRAFT_2621275 [Mycena olivaceomarginata]